MCLTYSPASKAKICVGLLFVLTACFGGKTSYPAHKHRQPPGAYSCVLFAFLDMIQPSTHQESPDFFSAFLSPLLLCPACCFPSTCCYLEIRTIFLHFG